MAEPKRRTGTSKATVQAKKMRTSHVCTRFTWLFHTCSTERMEQKERPARKAPSSGEAPPACRPAMRPPAIAKSSTISAGSTIVMGTSGSSQRDSTYGTTKTAAPPKAMAYARDTPTGRKRLSAVGCASAFSSDSRMSAMMSSAKAVAMMSCPVGVLSALRERAGVRPSIE